MCSNDIMCLTKLKFKYFDKASLTQRLYTNEIEFNTENRYKKTSTKAGLFLNSTGCGGSIQSSLIYNGIL